MPKIRPFKGIRPAPGLAERVAARAEDSSSAVRGAELASAEPLSFLHVTRGEADVPEFVEKGYMVRDSEASLYIYRISGWSHVQTGLICLVDAADYEAGLIKKHELLRDEKRDFQLAQIERLSGNCEPVLLAYDSDGKESDLLFDWASSHEPDIDIHDRIGMRHMLWAVSDPEFIRRAEGDMASVGAFYICDGHHRVAAAAKYAELHPESGEAQSFMAAVFHSEEMQILDYNREVADLNGLSPEAFLDALRSAGFKTVRTGHEPMMPSRHGEYTMVMGDDWYRIDRDDKELSAEAGGNTGDPVAGLDVSVLQNRILEPILGISDPKKDPRLSFVKGTEGIEALRDGVEAGKAVGFALFPVSMAEIIKVADAGLTMPPKSTCFSPKPLNGLVVYKI